VFAISYLDLAYNQIIVTIMMDYFKIITYFKYFIIFMLGLIVGRVLTAFQYYAMKPKK